MPFFCETNLSIVKDFRLKNNNCLDFTCKKKQQTKWIQVCVRIIIVNVYMYNFIVWGLLLFCFILSVRGKYTHFITYYSGWFLLLNFDFLLPVYRLLCLAYKTTKLQAFMNHCDMLHSVKPTNQTDSYVFIWKLKKKCH